MDAILHAPSLTPAEAVDVARRLYGIDAGATPMTSERDQNFRLQTPAGDRFVLKIANSTDERALLEAQNAAMAHVARRSSLSPRPVPALDVIGGDAPMMRNLLVLFVSAAVFMAAGAWRFQRRDL